MLSENDILLSLDKIDYELNSVRNQVKFIKKQLLDKETLLIGLKLKHADLIEQLRITKERSPKVSIEKSDSDKEINRFKSILPDLWNKV